MFKVFPAHVTPDGRKVPLIQGWQTQATSDPTQLALWQQVFKDRKLIWGLPTGPINGIFALDIDVKPGQANGFETIQSQHLSLPETLSQPTPSGGRHFIFKYPMDGNHYGNTSKFKPGLDTRGEGGWIAFYGFDYGKTLADAPPWVLNGRGAVLKDPATSVKLSPEIALNQFQESLDAIRNAPSGESNDTLNRESFKVGQIVASGSLSREFAEAELFKAAKERGKPDYEARATITSGLDGGSAKPITSPFGSAAPTVSIPIPPPPPPVARWTPSIVTRDALSDISKLRKPQLFQDWSAEDITLTTADGGTGKTTLALYESVCLAIGERFLGFDAKQTGRTLYITGEDTEKKLAAMLGAICRQMGLFENTPLANEKLEIVRNSVLIKKDSDLCLITKDRATGFLQPNPDAIRKILEAVHDLKPKRVVFDPIASFWGSESALNDMAKAVTRTMSELVESGIQVEMINHMGKTSSANKDVSQFAGRGGTGLVSHARIGRVYHALREEEYVNKTGEALPDKMSAFECTVNKFSDGSPLYNKQFLVVRNGYIFYRKDLSPQKQLEAERELSDNERIFGFILEERRNGRYPTKGVLEGYFMSQSSPISKDRIKRALSVLQYTGHMGEKVLGIDNPDVSVKGEAFTVVNVDGREV